MKYGDNDIRMEGNLKKRYKTLSFTYDFSAENDEVQFLLAMPYNTGHCATLITRVSSSENVSSCEFRQIRVKPIGTTLMRRSIPCIELLAGNRSNKKAIILMGRQHSGETPSSFVIHEIVTQLLKADIEKEFLLSKYDIYVFPIVNLDGVILGNYRCNAAGYDLNRCWDKEDVSKYPEVFYIKKEIMKIQKRQEIEFILDFHGHSTK